MTLAGTTRSARHLGMVLASAVLLAGCALADDARREFGSDPDRPARPGPTSAAPTAVRPPAASVPTGDPHGGDGQSGGPDGCPPSGVLVRPGTVSAAMGLRAMGIELVNCGTVPYTVNGYPEVLVLDEARAPLAVTVVRGSSGVASIEGFDTPPAPVTAAPGQRLAFGLVWRNTVNDTTTGPVNGTYLRIVPAPGEPPQTVRPEGHIDLGTTGRLGVTAWGPART